jgi:hypothetical protein
MTRSWQRGCAILAAVSFFGLLGVCVLLGVGIHARSIALPPVLLHNHQVWIGDRCRAYLNSAEQAERNCPPFYTIDVMVLEPTHRHYVLLQIPLR